MEFSWRAPSWLLDCGGWAGDYRQQVHWEWQALGRAACVLFWVPRDLETMPAFTTNIEFGILAATYPERIVLGLPADAPKNRYLRTVAKDFSVFSSAFGLHAANGPRADRPAIAIAETLFDATLAAMTKASAANAPT